MFGIFFGTFCYAVECLSIGCKALDLIPGTLTSNKQDFYSSKLPNNQINLSYFRLKMIKC